MTTPAAPASAPPSTATSQPLLEQMREFAESVISLDPEQAALRGGLSILVLIGAGLLMWGLRLLLKSMIAHVAEDNAQPKAPSRFGRWTLRIARIAIFVTAILVILRLWGFDFADLAQGPVGVVLGTMARIALIIALAFAAIEVIQIGIKGVFNRVAKRARNIRRASQLRTLAPVLTGVATTTLVIIATMMSLSEVGVEIGPLIAGAGIVGLAIGFGAQTLVKDFLTGIFLIIEDAVSVGDVIKIGEFGGVVEEMSIRTIKLRAYNGTLHIFPYSEAQVLHNMTKNFSFAVFDLSIDYSADISKALAAMKQVGTDLRADPEFAPLILQDIDIAGVDVLGDSAVVLKARIKTLPAQQWKIKREYLRRIKLGFDEAGVEIPFPHLKIVPPDAQH